ncbi:hypothetical protein QE441_002342 [Chryseobacterium sp. SORGH_AS909]|uniref:hypothetical protein n=1 Tax=Chryseobacterium sp. SORGH_AS_0909 TaxID=3041759 RepID=UPI0028565E32|nr:hypothetical protein [Chryseobacterium sp. SORGH_AS_0909]MDR6086548.1 hypothetical protein [Chryseobacterium sp. SORGH_AS_0909]
MKKILLTAGIILSGLVYSQVGVNNQTPSTTFDVRAKRDASGNITDNTQTIGMQAPRLTRAELTANTANYGTNQNGALIYITDISGGDAASGTQRENITSVGYYYFDAAAASGAGRWIKMAVGDGGSPYTANNGLTMTGNNTKLGGTLIENTTIAQDTYTTNFTSAATTGTSHFTVDGTTFNVDAVNNRVAIGTATPSAKLDVQGNQYINAAITSAASKNALDINIGQPSYSYGNRVENFGINMRTNTDSGGSQIARINFGDESTGTLNGTRYLSFSVGNPVLNELMYLTSSNNGRVGIGTTTPAGRLHIVENGSTSAITASYNTPGILLTGPSSSNGLSGPGLYFEALGNPTGQRVMKVNMTTDGTNGFLNYQSVSNDASASVTTIMSVVSNGRVGIGNYNPGAKLEVNNGNTNGAIKIVDGTQGSGKVLTSDANGLATWQTIPSATPYTASNGLTMASNNVKLGGTLTENTTIAQGNNSVTFSGNSNVNITTTNTSGYPLSIVHPLSSQHIAAGPADWRCNGYSCNRAGSLYWI